MPEALDIARELDLDLVEVAAEANPPVCRIMDYGKFKYESSQRAKESRKKASAISLKEMKYRPKIGKGDFDTKTAKVEKFLSGGHKVKITIMFRGREVFHPELGRKILERVNNHEFLIYLDPTYYGPFGATSDIGGGTMYPHISYACSTCAIIMKLGEIKQLDR